MKLTGKQTLKQLEFILTWRDNYFIREFEKDNRKRWERAVNNAYFKLKSQ